MTGAAPLAVTAAALVGLLGAAAELAGRSRPRRRPAPAGSVSGAPKRRPQAGPVQLPRWWSDLVADLGSPVEAGPGAALVLGLTAAAFAGGVLVGGVALGLIAGGVLASAVVLAGALVRGRQGRLVVSALPPALDALARASAAGAAPATALREAAAASSGPLAADLGAVLDRTDLAEPLQAGLERWARLRPLPEVRLVVSGLITAAWTGGSMAEAAGRLAATLRARAEASRLIAAQAAQARASATVVGVAPVAVVGVLSLADSAAARVLLSTPAGLVCLGLGFAMDAAAVWWMASMIRAAE